MIEENMQEGRFDIATVAGGALIIMMLSFVIGVYYDRQTSDATVDEQLKQQLNATQDKLFAAQELFKACASGKINATLSEFDVQNNDTLGHDCALATVSSYDGQIYSLSCNINNICRNAGWTNSSNETAYRIG